MPNTRPVSDLRNYAEVLKEIAVDAPVFLIFLWKQTIGFLVGGKYIVLYQTDGVMASIYWVLYGSCDYMKVLFVNHLIVS